MEDRFGRKIEYMRVSITDRCNLRCRYCMPDGIHQVPMAQILTYEQIREIVTAAAGLGIGHIRVTGGEPLVRRGCADLVGMLKEVDGVHRVTMTTNGVLLAQFLPDLLAAGLDGVNISLDTLDREKFRSITGRDDFDGVRRGMEAALDAGDRLRVKVNCVLQQGLNDTEWPGIAALAEDRPLDVRFIELMPIGTGRTCSGVSNTELIRRMKERWPEMKPDDSVHGSGPAVYMHIPGWKGSIGFISAMHGKFCDRCNRLRLTSRGMLKPCLCYGETEDLMKIFKEYPEEERRGEILRSTLERAILEKPAAHCFEHTEQITESMMMNCIGG